MSAGDGGSVFGWTAAIVDGTSGAVPLVPHPLSTVPAVNATKARVAMRIVGVRRVGDTVWYLRFVMSAI
jgi:hypothetical protein